MVPRKTVFRVKQEGSMLRISTMPVSPWKRDARGTGRPRTSLVRRIRSKTDALAAPVFFSLAVDGYAPLRPERGPRAASLQRTAVA
jgi:hypothetical protein